MPRTVLLRGGASLYWVGPEGRIDRRERLAATDEAAADAVAHGFRTLPASRRRGWGAPGSTPSVAEPAIADAMTDAGLPTAAATPAELRHAREQLPLEDLDGLRSLLLPVARIAASELLASPDETLIALAREEARVERALGRELGAQAQWVVARGALAEHAREAGRFGDAYRAHHAALEWRVETVATSHLPNLARLVGPKVAARLLAAAGSRRALARISASRLQLLGARRRPDPSRGPRFGVLFRAYGMDELPDDRRGAYARSLAAMAAIAARADATTQRDLGDRLLVRRDRRRTQLRGRGR